MATPILMPQAGQSMTEGRIVRWLVREGASVRRGEPLLEIETDKANMEVEASADGVLRKVLRLEGEVVPVRAPVAVIAGADEPLDLTGLVPAGAPASVSPPPEAQRPAASPAGGAGGAVSPAAGGSTTRGGPVAAAGPAEASRGGPFIIAGPPVDGARPPSRQERPSRQDRMRQDRAEGDRAGEDQPGGDRAGGDRVAASPLARRLAGERGVELGRLRGSGPRGRIIRRDVEAALASGASGVLPAAPAAPAAGRPARAPYPPPSPRPPERVLLEGMRRAIATALQRSKLAAPHFYATVEIDVTEALAERAARSREGLEVSVNDLMIRAAALALRDEPRVNCRVGEEAIEYPPEVNIGIAVGLEEGLVVPVLLRAQERSLAEIASESRRIIDLARKGKLVGSGQGTFTISNLGMMGIKCFTAVINPPEGAILAVGAALERAVPAAGGFLPRRILEATLSADHRAIDGLLAARFLARLKHLLEEPDRLF